MEKAPRLGRLLYKWFRPLLVLLGLCPFRNYLLELLSNSSKKRSGSPFLCGLRMTINGSFTVVASLQKRMKLCRRFLGKRQFVDPKAPHFASANIHLDAAQSIRVTDLTSGSKTFDLREHFHSRCRQLTAPARPSSAPSFYTSASTTNTGIASATG